MSGIETLDYALMHAAKSSYLGTDHFTVADLSDCEAIEYDALRRDFPYDHERLDEIVELLVGTACSGKKYIRVSGEDYPVEAVNFQLLKLNSEHIRFVFDCLKENTTRIQNIRQYLLATLYNAPITIGNYYSALVNHDICDGMI